MNINHAPACLTRLTETVSALHQGNGKSALPLDVNHQDGSDEVVWKARCGFDSSGKPLDLHYVGTLRQLDIFRGDYRVDVTPRPDGGTDSSFKFWGFHGWRSFGTEVARNAAGEILEVHNQEGDPIVPWGQVAKEVLSSPLDLGLAAGMGAWTGLMLPLLTGNFGSIPWFGLSAGVGVAVVLGTAASWVRNPNAMIPEAYG